MEKKSDAGPSTVEISRKDLEKLLQRLRPDLDPAQALATLAIDLPPLPPSQLIPQSVPVGTPEILGDVDAKEAYSGTTVPIEELEAEDGGEEVDQPAEVQGVKAEKPVEPARVEQVQATRSRQEFVVLVDDDDKDDEVTEEEVQLPRISNETGTTAIPDWQIPRNDDPEEEEEEEDEDELRYKRKQRSQRKPMSRDAAVQWAQQLTLPRGLGDTPRTEATAIPTLIELEAAEEERLRSEKKRKGKQREESAQKKARIESTIPAPQDEDSDEDEVLKWERRTKNRQDRLPTRYKKMVVNIDDQLLRWMVKFNNPKIEEK